MPTMSARDEAVVRHGPVSLGVCVLSIVGEPKGSPVMYANERPCTTWSEVLEEARAMDATGTGIEEGTRCSTSSSPSMPSAS